MTQIMAPEASEHHITMGLLADSFTPVPYTINNFLHYLQKKVGPAFNKEIDLIEIHADMIAFREKARELQLTFERDQRIERLVNLAEEAHNYANLYQGRANDNRRNNGLTRIFSSSTSKAKNTPHQEAAAGVFNILTASMYKVYHRVLDLRITSYPQQNAPYSPVLQRRLHQMVFCADDLAHVLKEAQGETAAKIREDAKQFSYEAARTLSLCQQGDQPPVYNNVYNSLAALTVTARGALLKQQKDPKPGLLTKVFRSQPPIINPCEVAFSRYQFIYNIALGLSTLSRNPTHAAKISP